MLCGLANNVAELTAARVLQGFGGAMMVPVGRLVLFRSIDKAALIGIMAYLQVPAQLGPVLGPPIGGFITTYFSWRWIFLVNVPLGVLGIVLVTLFFDNPKEDNPRPLDWAGFLLTGVALSCIMYGVEALGRGHGEVPVAAGLLVFGFAVGALALRHLHRTKHPVLDLSVFRVQTFRAGIYGGSAFRAGAGTLVFLLPLLLQLVFGLSAAASGSITFATAAGSLSMKIAGPRVIARFGFRHVIIINGVISAATIAMCAFFVPGTPLAVVFLLLLVAGFFQSLQFTATQALGYADVEPAADVDGDQYRQHGATVEPRLRHFDRRPAAAFVAHLARRGRARSFRFHRRVFRRDADGALLPRVFLVVAARCRRRGQRPPAEDSRIAAHALAALAADRSASTMSAGGNAHDQLEGRAGPHRRRRHRRA